jgi:hypothetical protein
MSFQANKEFNLEINHFIKRVAPGAFISTVSVSCRLLQEPLFNVIHQNNEYFCNPFFNINLNIAFIISQWVSTTACYGTGPAFGGMAEA